MKTLEFIKTLNCLPNSTEGNKVGRPSTGEIRRWLQNKAVIINGRTPLPEDEMDFPITQLVFFPKGRRKTTIL